MFEEKLGNIILISTILISLLLIGFIIFVAIYQRRYIKLEQEKMRQQKVHEMILAEAIIRSQEKERKRIGKDLHDDIAPLFAVALLNLKTHFKISKDEAVLNIDNAIGYIEDGINKLRNESHILHPSTLERLGFMEALKDFCNIFNQSKGCRIDVHSGLKSLSIDKFKQLMLYRIIQELVLNGVKHGETKIFKIGIDEYSNKLNLSLFHDGIRFTEQDYLFGLQNSYGLGLKNVQHRLNLLKAKLFFDINSEELGQVIVIQFPIS